MIVGTLGEIVFQVSEEQVETPHNVSWFGSARWAVHQRHNGHALTEFVGLDPDRISLSIQLAAHLGTPPMQELVKLWGYERGGEPVILMLGHKVYGKYRWSVISHETKMQSFDPMGNLTLCTVDVTLQEYLPGEEGIRAWNV